MAILKEIYDLSVELLDKRDGSGLLDQGRLLAIQKKFPALATTLSAEISQLCNLRREELLLTDMGDSVDLPDYPAYGVMPYGMAAILARQGGDSELADLFQRQYERLCQRIRLESGSVEDTEGALAGLGRRV